MHDYFGTLPRTLALPMQLEARANALAAGGLAEIGDGGGNLEWTVQFLLGADRVVGDRVVARGSDAGTECGARRKNVELDRFFVADDLRRGRREAERQGHQWDVVGPGGGLSQRFRDRIRALQCDRKSASKRNRLLEGSAEFPLFIVRVDSRVDASE